MNRLRCVVGLVLVVLASHSDAIAQSVGCELSRLEATEYHWAKATDGLAGQADPKGVDKAMVLRIANLVMAQKPAPRGAEGFWYGHFDGHAIIGQFSKPYAANVIIKPYLCANGKAVMNTGYTSSVAVYVNGLGSLGGRITLNGKEYSTVKSLLEVRSGYHYFNLNPTDTAQTDETWLVTYQDKLPFVVMTRKEFLTELIAHLTDRVLHSDEVLKSATQQRLERVRRLLLASPEDFLAQPAQVLPYGLDSFERFGSERRDPNLVYVVRNNAVYFDAKVSPYTPQYLTVLIRHQTKGAANTDFYNAVNKPELLEKLAALLGTK